MISRMSPDHEEDVLLGYILDYLQFFVGKLYQSVLSGPPVYLVSNRFTDMSGRARSACSVLNMDIFLNGSYSHAEGKQ